MKVKQITEELNNKILAYICNDYNNYDYYEVRNGDCYYKNEYIGKLYEKSNDLYMNVYFQPLQPIEYIDLKITLRKDDGNL